MMLHEWRSAPPARSLILSALSADAPSTTLKSLTRIGRLFGVDAPAIRVAVGRLVRDGLLRQTERGQYAIGDRGTAVRARVRSWRTAEARTRPWTGTWVIILVGHLGRTDRTRLRTRERALRLSGFAQADEGFWARPDNLQATVAEIIGQAVELGLDPNAVAFGGAEALPQDLARLESLWSGDDLAASYRGWIDELEASLTRIRGMDVESAARESFLLGQAVIRSISLDPLLPAEMVDIRLRHRMIELMIAYDEIGKQCWARFDEQHAQSVGAPRGGISGGRRAKR